MKSRVTQKTNDSSVTVAPPAGEIRRLIDSSRRVLVGSHIDPDGDAIGTQLAFAAYLRSLGKEVFLVRDAEIPRKYRFLDGIEQIRHIDEYADDFSIDLAVVLECPVLDRIGRAARFLTPDVKIINIDHHYESGDFGVVNWVDPTRSSVGEMVFDLLEALEADLTPPMAEQLYTAIMTDTGRFRYQATSPRTMDVIGQLMAAGADPKKITDQVYFNLDVAAMKLFAGVLGTIEFHDDDHLCLLTLTKQLLEDSGADVSESDGLVDYTLYTDTVETGALLKEQDESHTRVSLRSRDGINVSEIASRYGGGGHFNASGCTVPLGLAEAKQEIIKALSEARRGKKN